MYICPYMCNEGFQGLCPLEDMVGSSFFWSVYIAFKSALHLPQRAIHLCLTHSMVMLRLIDAW